MGDINGFNEVIENVEIYLDKNGLDTQLELVLHMARVRKLDCLGMNRESLFDAGKPAVELLQTIGDDFFEIESIATMLCFVESYELVKKLMEKALNALNTNLVSHERCEATKLIVFCNVSYRLLYSRFYDNEDPKGVATIFNHCTESGIALCEKMGADALVLRTILLVRQAVFYEDFAELDETLLALKHLDNRQAFTGMLDDIAEFYHKMDTAPPTDTIHLLLGHQIRTRREEIGLSREELATRVGMGMDSLRAVERGTRGFSMSNFMACAKALGIDYNYMLGNLSTHPQNISEDPKTREILTLMSALSDRGKSHLLEYTKILVKFDGMNQPLKSPIKIQKKRQPPKDKD